MSAAFPTGDKRLAVKRKLGDVIEGIERAARSLPGGPLRLGIETRLSAIVAAIGALEARVIDAATPKPKGFLR